VLPLQNRMGDKVPVILAVSLIVRQRCPLCDFQVINTGRAARKFPIGLLTTVYRSNSTPAPGPSRSPTLSPQRPNPCPNCHFRIFPTFEFKPWRPDVPPRRTHQGPLVVSALLILRVANLSMVGRERLACDN
jgi:hypothetical protein